MVIAILVVEFETDSRRLAPEAPKEFALLPVLAGTGRNDPFVQHGGGGDSAAVTPREQGAADAEEGLVERLRLRPPKAGDLGTPRHPLGDYRDTAKFCGGCNDYEGGVTITIGEASIRFACTAARSDRMRWSGASLRAVILVLLAPPAAPKIM